jgi:hypothetical protein
MVHFFQLRALLLHEPSRYELSSIFNYLPLKPMSQPHDLEVPTAHNLWRLSRFHGLGMSAVERRRRMLHKIPNSSGLASWD